MNNPSRIQFTNGNVTKYVYSATGEKLRTIHQTAAPNITVVMGTTHELTASELLYEDVTDYYLGGKMTVKNGRMDKYYFDGGYAQAKTNEATLADNFSLYFYNFDHLGNVHEVIDEKGDVVQITNYYPFGTPYSAEDCATHNPDQQNHKYNGKEFDTTHGLNTYDYGARQYNSLVGRWDRMDPLCEKYYSVSPYAYCLNNPMKYVDPDGMKVYLFATTLPMNNNIAKSIIKPATHTFIVITDNENKPVRYAAYGPENENISGKDRLMECSYTQDIEVYKDYFNSKGNDNLKMAVEIPVPKGLTSEQFDKKVVKVINSFGNNNGIKYSIFPMTETQGNCNTSSSTILNKSGASKQIMQLLEKVIPGISTGFNADSTKPWTKAEQEKAVEENKKENK